MKVKELKNKKFEGKKSKVRRYEIKLEDNKFRKSRWRYRLSVRLWTFPPSS